MGNLIDLTKKASIVLEKKNLSTVKANIVVAMDKSGSMSYRFQSGVVQEVIDRLLGIGMNMDVNKSIEVYAFNTSSRKIGVANEQNHRNFVQSANFSVGGGTNYAPVMKQIIADVGTPIGPVEVESKGLFGKLFGKKEMTTLDVQTQDYPTIVFFVTDGDNFDKPDTIHVMREASKQGIFWQFIGIGSERFEFLQKLDDLDGRYIDNADFFSVNDIMKTSDEDLYNRILNEIPGWLTQAKAKGLVR